MINKEIETASKISFKSIIGFFPSNERKAMLIKRIPIETDINSKNNFLIIFFNFNKFESYYVVKSDEKGVSACS